MTAERDEFGRPKNLCLRPTSFGWTDETKSAYAHIGKGSPRPCILRAGHSPLCVHGYDEQSMWRAFDYQNQTLKGKP